MDVLYTVRHSQFDDLELRYSLRSVNLYFPHVRKVWIFGDRPSFLVDDTSRVEHVPHDRVAHILGCRTPVTSTFTMLILASLLPELTSEYLWFCDDYVLLEYLSEEEARKTRYLQDISRVKQRRRGLYPDALWRTHALLARFGYTGWNFESHTPTRLTKKQVLNAYADFRDFVTEDRFHGPLASTAILNHTYRKERMELTMVAKEGRRAAFYRKPPSYEEIVEKTRGKVFLNYDEGAFGQGLRRFLAERFPNPSIYERADGVGIDGKPSLSTATAAISSPRLDAVFGGHYRAHAAEVKETVSGAGSTLQATTATRDWLLKICRSHNIRSIVDLGCGDWNWMRLVVPSLELDWYQGYDIVPELIEYNHQEYGSEKIAFSVADITSLVIPTADLVICRDCLTHLSYEHIRRVLTAVKRSGAMYFMATTYPKATNRDGADGPWRPLNLTAAPCDLLSFDDSVLEGTWPDLGEKRLALFPVERWPMIVG